MPFYHGFKSWLPVLCLALAGFIFVTTELMPIGLLPDIARAMGKSEAYTGLLITVYAWTVALTSLPLTMAFARLNRRTLLLFLLAGFTLSQWLAAAATNFAFLMAARLMTSLCHALFWSIAPPLAVRVAPGHGATKALSLLAAVTSLASILGMPLGTIIGHQFGWRLTFGLVGLISLVFALILFKFLPSAPGRGRDKEESAPRPWHNPQLRRIYLLTALTVAGHFTAFTYMTPLLAQSGGFSPTVIAWLLLTLGGAGIAGNLLVSRFFDQHPKVCLMTALTVLTFCLLAARFLGASLPSAVLLCLAWGASMSASGLMFQTTVIKRAGDNPDVANSLYSAIFNIGIGGGALVGNKIFNALGIGAVNLGGAAFVAGAALLAWAFLKSLAAKPS